MGRDKLDFLLSLYRISIRSKKWTCYIQYKTDCEINKLKTKDIMDLLAFRNDLADALVNCPSQKVVDVQKRMTIILQL